MIEYICLVLTYLLEPSDGASSIELGEITMFLFMNSSYVSLHLMPEGNFTCSIVLISIIKVKKKY